MRGIGKPLGAALLAVALLAGTSASARAASPADWLYEPTTFTAIELELPQESIETLRKEPEENYVEGFFSIAETNGTPDEVGPYSEPIKVGVRLKGSIGSLRTIDEKAAFKIKFGEFVEGQTFDGLEKMTLNNMVQDPSMIHETLAYQAFHDMGVYAPHTGFTYLKINGESYGLHLDIETQDQIALEKQFGPFEAPPQHLYEGEYGADVSASRWEELEVQEGKKKKEGDKADLEALLAAVEGSGSSFSERVAGKADLNEMTRMWLTEKYIGHWDGYSGQVGGLQPNNYYLYSDASGDFQMLPWGTDQTWGSRLDFGGAANGVLFTDCLADSACNSLYGDAGSEALKALEPAALDLTARCTAAAELPWRELEEEENAGTERLPPYTVAEGKDAVASARDFIADRPEELASYLGTTAPGSGVAPVECPPLRPIGGFPEEEGEEEEGGGEKEKGGEEKSGGSGPVIVPMSPRQTLVAQPLLAGRAHRGANGVTLDVTAPGAGQLSLVGSYAGAKGHTRACGGRSRAAATGAATVPCHFTKGFRRALDEGTRRVKLTLSFTPADGTAAQSLRRTLRVHR